MGAVTPLEAIVDGLATYRLTRLVIDDKVTAKLRNAAVKRWGQEGIGYLVNCPWCTSAYVGLGVALARRYAPKVWAPISDALAFSAAAGLISTHE